MPNTTNIIVELRRKAGLTQEQVASHLGLTYSSYSRLEKRPETIKLGRLKRIAALFGVELPQIVGELPETVSLGGYGRAFDIKEIRDGELERTGRSANFSHAATVDSFALVVPDDAMAPDLSEDDLVLIDTGYDPAAGTLVLAQAPVTGEFVLRKYAPLHASDPNGPGFQLRSNDPNIGPIFCKPRSGRVVGVVAQLLRTFL